MIRCRCPWNIIAVRAAREPGNPEDLERRTAGSHEEPRHLQQLIDRAREFGALRTAVVHPTDEVSLLGAIEAARQGLISPVLVGPGQAIREVARAAQIDLSPYSLVAAEHDSQSATRAIAMARAGEVQALMKGALHTDELMHAAVDPEHGLRAVRRASHVFVIESPQYPRLLFITDAAINIYPTLEDKRDIVQNAIDLARTLGVRSPRVAILSALELVTSRIKSTIEAAALCKMADRGQIEGGVLDGPFGFDNAVSSEAAATKHIVSPVAGRADIFVVPDIEAGNMLAKQLEYLSGARLAGVVLGMRVPIVLTSRADDTAARLASCALAILWAHRRPLDVA